MTFVLIGIALIPTIIIFSAVLKKTPTIKKEPFKRVAKVFIMSAVSTIIAGILEIIGTIILALAVFMPKASGTKIDSSEIENASMIFLFALCLLVIGPAEEACKYFTFKRNIFNDREFDHTYDGVVYGAAAALGFATLENVIYVLQYGLLTGLLRAILSVPLHAFTGILMGYYFGLSKFKKYNNIEYDKNPQRRAFLISVVVHGMYDFLLMAAKSEAAPEFFFVFAYAGVIAIMILVYVLMYRIINKASEQDLIIYGEYYYQHLNGQFQDMVGKTNENGAVFATVNQTVPNYTTNANGIPPHTTAYQTAAWQYGSQQNDTTNANGIPPHMTAGQPAAWQYQSQPNSTTYQQPVSYQYGGAQNGQYGYQPNNTYQTPNFNPYIQGQYVPKNNTYHQSTATTYGQNPGSVQQPYIPTQSITPERIKFCNQCGNRLTADNKYCPICGNRI